MIKQASDEEKILQVTGRLMNRARNIFTGSRGEFTGGDYQSIIGLFGKVLVQVEDDDYQGDTRVLLENHGRYGFLNFGWGSCSGCDALQACNNFDDGERLILDLESGIKWFDTLQEAQAYISHEDRKQSYYYHEKEWDDFVSQVLAYKDTK